MGPGSSMRISDGGSCLLPVALDLLGRRLPRRLRGLLRLRLPHAQLGGVALGLQQLQVPARLLHVHLRTDRDVEALRELTV